MKKNVLVFGLIAGLIVSVFMVLSMANIFDASDLNHSMLLGYASMLIAFSFVYVGIRNYRDNYNMGVITFGQAFKTGILITLIASTLYVITWMIDFNFFIPDFMDKYAAHMLDQAKASGASAAEIQKQAAEMESYKEMYKSQVMVVLLTYMEILPVGLVITLISAFLLKRKTARTDANLA